MALSGSFYTNVGSHWRLQLEWSATQNVSANQSTITAKLYWIALDGYGAVNSSATKDGSVTIDGTVYTFSGAGLASLSANQKKLLTTKSKTVTHNADGTKSVSLDGVFNAEVTLSGTYYGAINLTGQTVTLNTIPRKSTLSSSANFTAGSDYTLTISRASSSFTHKAYIDVQKSDGTWVNIKSIDFSTTETSKSSAFSTTEKTNIFSYLAGRSSMATRINLHTYSGGTDIGYNTYTGTVTSPNASTGSIGNPTGVSDASGQGNSTIYTDQSITINISRADSEFTHTLEFKLSNSATPFKTISGVGSSTTFTFSSDEQNTIHNAMTSLVELDGQVDITTYYNGKIVKDTVPMDFNYRVRNAEPVFSDTALYYADNDTTITAITGDTTAIVQNLSKLKVLIPVASKAVGQKKATVTQYIVTFAGQEQTIAYADTDLYVYFDKADAKNDQTIIVKAVDTRGLTSTISRTVPMIPYSAPTISGTAKRKNGFDSDTTLTGKGGFTAVTTTKGQVNGIKAVKYHFKKTTDATTVSTWATWKTWTPTISGTTFTVPAVIETLDYQYSWSVEFQVQDNFGTVVYFPITVSQGKPILFIDSVLKTVGIGKFSTSYMLDVGGDANFDGKLNVKGINSIMNGLDINWYNIKNIWEMWAGVLHVSTNADITGNLTVGGTLTMSGGTIVLPSSRYATAGAGIDANNSDIMGLNQLIFNDTLDGGTEGIQFPKTGTPSNSTDWSLYDTFRVKDGIGYLNEKPIFRNDFEVLWTGGSYVNDAQTITPTKKITDCPNGWVLVWSDYSSGVANNYDFIYTFIPKYHVVQWGGLGIHCIIASNTANTNAYLSSKYIYVSEASFKGHAVNDDGTINNNVVLRNVLSY